MIIPWLKGILSWRSVPVTWTIVALNVFIFLLTYQPEKRQHSNLMSNRQDMVLTGILYRQFHQVDQDIPLSKLNPDVLILAGSRGLRDPHFLVQAESFQFEGDEVAIKNWRLDIRKYRDQFASRSSYLFGLINYQNRPLTWITYQFMHAGIIHLASNMLLLLVFAGSLELLLGGPAVILIYLLSGLAGGLGFHLLSQYSIAPMVGASGALSGIMTCYAAFERKRRVSFFYFLSPFQNYYGLIYLPTWLIFPLCFLTDVASYLSTPAELGSGVAYTAHIGGAVFGAMIGYALRFSGVKFSVLPPEQSRVGEGFL